MTDEPGYLLYEGWARGLRGRLHRTAMLLVLDSFWSKPFASRWRRLGENERAHPCSLQARRAHSTPALATSFFARARCGASTIWPLNVNA